MKNIKFLSAILSLVFVVSISVSAQTLTSLEGERINIENQTGKVVVLAIGATWLPLSTQQIAAVNRLAKKYAGRDVAIYFVATDSAMPRSKNFASDEVIGKYAAGNKLTVPILRDSDGLLTIKKFGVDQLPSFIILDKTGKPATEPFGGITTDPKSDIATPLSQAIDRLL